MKKFFLLIVFVSSIVFSQENKDSNAFDVTVFRGNVLPHTSDLYHLQGHPEGVMLSFSKQTHGSEEWQSAYNYPDYGGYFLYQDFNNDFLGKTYAIGVHYNFYFLHKNLMFKLTQGISYATNPYEKEFNSKNKAFGTSILNNTNLGLYFKKENLIDRVGMQAGLLFTHYSNGRTKSPNSGINTLAINFGLNYNLDERKVNVKDTTLTKASYKEPLKYNFVFRTGVNESLVINSGQHPFYHIGFYADKRIGRKSAFQFGSELFLTTSFKDFIKYKSVAFPERNIDPNTDYKRVGVFVGHELFINRISIEAQLGYYIYDPLHNEISIYDRVGMKYNFSKKVFAGFTIKTHMFLAEALEFGLGVRL